MDPLTFFILIITGIYFYSTGSIFFAFLTGILALILVLTSGGSVTSSSASHAHAESHSATLYPEKMDINIYDDAPGPPGYKKLGEGIFNTGSFVARNIGKLFTWSKDHPDKKEGHP